MIDMHILQFEYKDINGHLVFLKVHNTFKHHYTGETMRCVQLDWIIDGWAQSFFGTINEATFMKYYERRTNKEGKHEQLEVH